MFTHYEDAQKDYVLSIAKLLKGTYHKISADLEQRSYEIGGIVGIMPVVAKLVIKPRADHHIEVYIKIVELQTENCVYTLCSAPDFVYENLEKWVDLKTREVVNGTKS